MRTSFRRGFSLIELLTVIAIIAVLAAILFPVFARVKESARQTTCLSNMSEIYRAVSMYKTTYGEYPPMLLGPVQNGVSASQAQGYLYPSLIKSIDVFHCPDNPVVNQNLAVTAIYGPNAIGWSNPATVGDAGFKLNAPAGPIQFYGYDSYDTTCVIGDNGPNGNEVVYARGWTNTPGRGDAPNQLEYPNPPLDRTVISWCNYHVAVAKGEMCPVLLASGTAKPINYKDINSKGWQFVGP